MSVHLHMHAKVFPSILITITYYSNVNLENFMCATRFTSVLRLTAHTHEGIKGVPEAAK